MRTHDHSLPKSFWYHGGVALVYIGLLLADLLLRPGSQALLETVDNLAQAGSLLLGIILCFDDLFRSGRWRKGRSETLHTAYSAHRWIPRIFGLTILSTALGQIIPLYYTQYLHLQVPTPSWADAFNIGAYLLLLVCLLLLPTYQLAKATRMRLLLDGCMILATVLTFSWFFLLGPTLLHTHETMLAKIVESAYPCADFLLITCLLLLLPRVTSPLLRPTVLLFAFALGTLVLTDSLFEYQMLLGTYAVGEVLDVGWPLSILLIALAVKALRETQSWQAAPVPVRPAASDNSTPLAAPSLWRAMLPYVLVPLTLLLVTYTLQTHSHPVLTLGVCLGSMFVLGFVFARQLVALHETMSYARQTRQLNQELRQMQDVVQSQNHALAEANVRLESLATTDPLTGLPNHRSLSEQLDREWERARRYGHPLSLIFFDADRFKRINDTWGHAVGDVVLRQLGERVSSVLRGGDTLGRYGGEEFLVLLPETDTQEAQAVAERMRAAVAALPLATTQVEGGLPVTISSGIATFPIDGQTSSELVHKADEAMYWAKRLGRNQVRASAEALGALHANTPVMPGKMHERTADTLLDGLSREHVLQADQLTAIYSLMWLIEMRDHGISSHSYHVSDLATAIAQEMGLEPQRIVDISTAALLHDIGKIAIPDALLQKAGALSAEEREIIKQHAELGAQILEVSPSLRELIPAIRHHHEHWNGAGYPAQLQGEDIPIEARIIGVAEAYDAICTPRAYQAHRTWQEALTELQRCAGTQFDPFVVQALVTVAARHRADTAAQQQELAEVV